MVNPSPENIVKALFEIYGYTFSERLCIDLSEQKAEELFKLAVASLLYSLCNDWRVTVKAYEALHERGVLASPGSLQSSRIDVRIDSMDEAGFIRGDRPAAVMLGELASTINSRYEGNLSKLRHRSQYRRNDERKLLEELPGIDRVSSDFYLQEIQLQWDENYPYAGESALAGAADLGFGHDAVSLAQLVHREQYPLLVSSLMQMEQEENAGDILYEARKLESFVTLEP